MNSSDVTLRSLTYHDLSISDPSLENSLPSPHGNPWKSTTSIHRPPWGNGARPLRANLLLQRPFSFCLRLQLVALEIGIGTRHTSPKSFFSDQFPPKLSGPMWSYQGVIQNNSNRHLEARHPKKLEQHLKEVVKFPGWAGFRFPEWTCVSHVIWERVPWCSMFIFFSIALSLSSLADIGSNFM